MKKFLLMALPMALAWNLSAKTVVDEIPGTLTLTASYEQHVLDCESGAVWLITAKNDGNGPQFKVGGSGIVTQTSIGKVRNVTVNWGKKSNENVVVYGSHEPYTASSGEIAGSLLGYVEFVANGTSSLNIDGDWEYIGITSTANTGKACQIVKMLITWDAEESTEVDPQDGLVINEVCGNDNTANDGSEDWIEIANPTAGAISLEGVKLVLVDDDAVETVLYTYGNGDALEAGAYLLCNRKPEINNGVYGNGQFEVGIPHSKNFILRLVSASGNTLDKFDKRAALTDNGHHNKGGSYSRFPDMTGDWMAAENCTPAAANDGTPIQPVYRKFKRVLSSDELAEAAGCIILNEDYKMAMASAWGATSSGGVYQLAIPCTIENGVAVVDVNNAAVCTFERLDYGYFALRFGETNNYNNENRYMACDGVKNLKFKKSADKSGVAANVSFGADDHASISFGDGLAGVLQFNPKDDGTSRFMNYDPSDKPEDHYDVYIYRLMKDEDSVEEIFVEEAIDADAPAYNVMGIRVDANYKGIVIKNGKKIVR